MTTWSEVTPDVLNTAVDLMVRYHPELMEARIGFVFRDVAQRTNGRDILGQASKIGDRARVAGLDLDFLIWLSELDWKEMNFVARQALLDHQLCHCTVIDGEPKLRPHDIEEFGVIIERYGLWSPSLRQAGPAIHKAVQLELTTDLRRRGAVLAVKPEQVEVE